MENLQREHINADEVLMAMREHRIEDITSVKHGILETDGTISIVTEDTPTTITKRRLRRRGHLVLLC